MLSQIPAPVLLLSLFLFQGILPELTGGCRDGVGYLLGLSVAQWSQEHLLQPSVLAGALYVGSWLGFHVLGG